MKFLTKYIEPFGGFDRAVFVFLTVKTNLCATPPKYRIRGAPRPHLFLYGIYYLVTNLNMGSLSSLVLYFGYMGVMSYGLAVMTGAIGFLASWAFVRYIYAALKVD